MSEDPIVGIRETAAPFSNRLTPDQLERLAILSEELGEAQQAIGKIIRHSFDSFDPTKPAIEMDGQMFRLTNRDDLEKELGDVSAAMSLMFLGGELNRAKVTGYAELKMQSIRRWLHHFSINIPERH